ncbi:MAG: hypothetical protein WCV63_05260 [Negativicutes bacterium]|jgi:hypothetical protein
MNIDRLRRTLQRLRDQYNHKCDLPRELISHLAVRKNAIVMRITSPNEKEVLRPEIYLRRNANEVKFVCELAKSQYNLNVVDELITPRRIGRKGVIFEQALLFDKNFEAGSAYEELEHDSFKAVTAQLKKFSNRVPQATDVYVFDSRFSLLVFQGFYSEYELEWLKSKPWREENADLMAAAMKSAVVELGFGDRIKTVNPWFSFESNRGLVLIEFKAREKKSE